MMLWKRSNIALDIGRARVRACQFTWRGGKLAGACEVFADAPQTDDSGPADQSAAHRAGRLLQQAEFHGRRAAIGANVPPLAFQALTVPDAMFAAPETEWDTMLRFEGARLLKLQPDEIEVAAWPLPRRGAGRANLAICALPQSEIARDQQLCAALGVELYRVDAAPLALIRAGWAAGPPGEPENPDRALWAVLDIGATRSTLAIAIGPTCIYVRSLPHGGDALTASIAETLGLQTAMAERVKLELSAEWDEEGASEAEVDGAARAQLVHVGTIRSGLITRLRTLTAEVRRALTYSLESTGETAPSGLYLSGGGAALRGVCQHFSRALGVGAHMLTPRRALARWPGAARCLRYPDEPAMTTAVGLALGDAP
ncbi:MAG: pilus assembly protein PilM [Phycisphaerae bacterium]|nr:pilus assembly protein PilM [Phycisphaerae bacterium]